MLVSTHNLGSVPEFCDRVVLINRTVLAAGPTAEVFTEANLARAFGGVLRQFNFDDAALHDDTTARSHRADRRRASAGVLRQGHNTAAGTGRETQGGRNVMIGELLVPFSYEYMLKAILVSALIGGVCAFLSAYLTLKGWSLMGDALSHSVVPGVARSLHSRLAVCGRRIHHRHARRRRHGLRQAAHAAARGRRDRRGLHLVLCARAADGLDLARARSTCGPSSSATSSASRMGTSFRW